MVGSGHSWAGLFGGDVTGSGCHLPWLSAVTWWVRAHWGASLGGVVRGGSIDEPAPGWPKCG